MGPTTQGDLFEDRIMESAVCRGLRCDQAPRGLPYDLVIAGKRVQCKSKTLCSGGFRLHGTRRIGRDEFDILALTYRANAQDSFGLIYLIPMLQLPGDAGKVVAGLRQAWLSQHPEFIEAWGSFDEQG